MKQKPTNLETPLEPRIENTSDLVKAILRRWYIVLLASFLMCATGLPAIWLLIKPLNSISGAIKVAPILSNILTGEADRGEISNYQMFMQTQVQLITSSRVVQRVADNLSDKNLSFFKERINRPAARLKQTLSGTKTNPDLASVLKEAILDGIITVGTNRQSELIDVTMKSKNEEEAKQIVDTFISAYMAVEVSSSIQSQDQNLRLLENEQKVLAETLQSQNEAIHQLAEEYGTIDLVSRQDMKLKRVTTLLSELTQVEASRISLEARVQFLEQAKEQSIVPETLLKMRDEHINTDPIYQELTRGIVELERDLVITKQAITPGNPVIKQKQQLLDAFQRRLEEKRQEIAEAFDKLVSEEIKKTREEIIFNARAQLEQTKVHEKHLREVLATEDTQTIELGRKQLEIQNLQFRQDLDREMYDTVCRRIRDLEMERKRPARVSVAYNADINYIRDKRIKYSAALVFASLACGLGLALLRDKADKRLRTPDDISKRIDIRVLGTTTSPHAIKPSLFPAQIARDYQTIRANLGLFNGGEMLKKLTITSPRMREGKTTFAINLAISMTRSGKRVLLIDGDLRKPDIANLLNLPKHAKGLQNVLSGIELDQAISSIDSAGLNVLASHSRNGNDAYELITSPTMTQYINTLSHNYDYIIIDTPPVLAFPDALLWAKITGAVILTGFAGQTTTPDITEAKQRLTQINVRLLGIVLNNVRADRGYYRYGYNYYAQNPNVHRDSTRTKTKLFLPIQDCKGNSKNPDRQQSKTQS